MSTDLITADLASLNEYRADIERIVAFGGELTVTNDGEAEMAAEVLGRIASTKKSIKEARLRVTRPLDESKKAAIDLEKAILEPLEPVDRTLRAGLGNYQAEQQRKIREEQERIDRERREAEAKARAEAEAAARKAAEATEEEAEEAEAEADLARARELVKKAEPKQEVLPAGPTKAASGTASTRMVWKATVTDEAKVPREFLKVDTVAINKAVREGVREIPGVKIEQEPEVSVKA